MALSGSIQVSCQPFDVAFHPSENLISIGLISGSVILSKIDESSPGPSESGSTARRPSPSEVHKCWSKKAHKQACRAVTFMDGGESLLSASSDQSLVLRDTASGKRVWANHHAHEAAVNRLEPLSEAIVASGDDDGEIKVWDVRQPSCCAAMSVHDDFIADMHHAAAREKLLAVSGDGTLSVFDLREYKKDARSEYAEDELLSVTLVKHGRKVICGSQEGVLLLYSWGHFNDCSDRFPGHGQSIDAVLKFDEDTVITGAQDGLIRMVSILPNAFAGVVGQHMDCPVERLALSGDRTLLASASHDNVVKLWDMTALICGHVSEGGHADEVEEASPEEEQERVTPEVSPGTGSRREEIDPASGDDEEEKMYSKRRKKQLTKDDRQKGKKGQSSRLTDFFADL